MVLRQCPRSATLTYIRLATAPRANHHLAATANYNASSTFDNLESQPYTIFVFTKLKFIQLQLLNLNYF